MAVKIFNVVLYIDNGIRSPCTDIIYELHLLKYDACMVYLHQSKCLDLLAIRNSPIPLPKNAQSYYVICI